MIFCSTSASSEETAAASAGASGAASGLAGGGAGFGSVIGPATRSGVARIREIGGRNERVLVASPSARLGRGFFSSISETVSIGCLGAFGASAGGGDFAAGAPGALVAIA